MPLLSYNGYSHTALEYELNLLVQACEALSFSDLADYLANFSKPFISSAYLSLLIIESGSDIDLLIAHRHLLQGLDIVLILPGKDRSVAQRSHLISPRVTLFDIPEPGNICFLLSNLLKNRLKKQANWMRSIYGETNSKTGQ